MSNHRLPSKIKKNTPNYQTTHKTHHKNHKEHGWCIKKSISGPLKSLTNNRFHWQNVRDFRMCETGSKRNRQTDASDNTHIMFLLFPCGSSADALNLFLSLAALHFLLLHKTVGSALFHENFNTKQKLSICTKHNFYLRRRSTKSGSWSKIVFSSFVCSRTNNQQQKKNE